MRHSVLYLIALLIILSFRVYGQEENTAIYQSKRYLDINLKSLSKYKERVQKKQTKLLSKLKKKEERFAKKLKRRDSTAFARYQDNPITFDSISKIEHTKASTQKISRVPNATIDSLKGIKNFLESKAHVTGDGPSVTDGYENKLSTLKGDLNHNDQISQSIAQRTSFLKSINKAKNWKNITSIKSIQKNAFYSGEQIKALKEIANTPSKSEEKALEYLQGQKGFDDGIKYTDIQTLSGNTSTGDLEKMGFQTKKKMAAQLQKRFGSNLSGLQQSVGGQIKEYADNIKKVKEAKNTVLETKSSVRDLQHIQKPDFKINPMKCVPFGQRIEKQFNWQTTRASFDGKPAMLQLSIMAGIKQTPKLSYGLGVATVFGLGQNWSNVKFSLEGIGLRTYIAWQWIYGIGAYGGYERMYKAVTLSNPVETQSTIKETPHNKNEYNESVLLGLTKAYHINNKIDGSVQVLYDIWWKEKGLRSPILLRFATMKI